MKVTKTDKGRRFLKIDPLMNYFNMCDLENQIQATESQCCNVRVALFSQGNVFSVFFFLLLLRGFFVYGEQPLIVILSLTAITQMVSIYLGARSFRMFAFVLQIIRNFVVVFCTSLFLVGINLASSINCVSKQC